MIGSSKKLLMGAAGNAGGGASLDITDVFSTYLYEGNGSAQTITNGIDLDGEGGLVWIKGRTGSAKYNSLVDSERGNGQVLFSDSTGAEVDYGATGVVLTSNGFSIDSNQQNLNGNGEDIASWTFRKAPKFFDVVTYTGTGSTGLVLNHDLGCEVGTVFIKRTDTTNNWYVHHRSVGGTQHLILDNAGAATSYGGTELTTSTTSITINMANNITNASGGTYVAYLFAHNDGDGEFGPDGSDIIKCGSFPWGSSSGTEVDLGFEPQWILFKAADQSGKDWFIFDAMRGIVTGGLSGDGDAALFPNTSGAENVNTWGVDLTPTGFIAYGNNIASSGNIIYIAIRRGPLAQPESATEVFDVDLTTSTSAFSVGFPVDLWLGKETTRANGTFVSDRLRGGTKYLLTPSTAAEATDSGGIAVFDLQDSFSQGAASQELVNWMWKRAPGFCDVVAYTGNGTAGKTVSHNLGVAPEMMWIKCRSNTDNWAVYHKDVGPAKVIYLNSNTASSATTTRFNNVNPTNSVFTLGTDAEVNGSSRTYISYLFATLDGVSKVGSYTGNGSSQTIDCGFTSGARFILIKRTDGSGDWCVWDTARGIVAGDDPRLKLNTTDAENDNADEIDPHSSGFIVNRVGGGQSAQINENNDEYIFYAIA